MSIDVFGDVVLFCRGCDLSVLVTDLIDRSADVLKAVTGFLDATDAGFGHFQAALHLLGNVPGTSGQTTEQAVDLPGRFRCAFDQRANFVSHYDESASMFTSACGLNGCVQRQLARLVGDRVDGIRSEERR